MSKDPIRAGEIVVFNVDVSSAYQINIHDKLYFFVFSLCQCQLLGSNIYFHRNSLAPFHNSILSTPTGLDTHYFAINQFCFGRGEGYRALVGMKIDEIGLDVQYVELCEPPCIKVF